MVNIGWGGVFQCRHTPEKRNWRRVKTRDGGVSFLERAAKSHVTPQGSTKKHSGGEARGSTGIPSVKGGSFRGGGLPLFCGVRSGQDHATNLRRSETDKLADVVKPRSERQKLGGRKEGLIGLTTHAGDRDIGCRVQ